MSNLSDQEHKVLIMLAQRNGCNSCGDYMNGQWAEIYTTFFVCHICGMHVSGRVDDTIHGRNYADHGRKHLEDSKLLAFI